MSSVPQIKVPATYMRGGTSKGVFFKLDDLPEAAQVAGKARDQLLLRVIGSPDPYGKQIDGMGGATSSTSKTVILAKSTQPEHDVDYLLVGGYAVILHGYGRSTLNTSQEMERVQERADKTASELRRAQAELRVTQADNERARAEAATLQEKVNFILVPSPYVCDDTWTLNPLSFRRSSMNFSILNSCDPSAIINIFSS